MKEPEDNAMDRFLSLDHWTLFKIGEKSKRLINDIKIFHVLYDENLDVSIALYSTNERDLNLLAVKHKNGLAKFQESLMPGLNLEPDEKITDINQSIYMSTILTNFGKCFIWRRKIQTGLNSQSFILLVEDSQPTLLSSTQNVVKLRLSPFGNIIYQTLYKQLFVCTIQQSSSSVKFANQLRHVLLRVNNVDDFDCTQKTLVVLDRVNGVCQLIPINHLIDAKWKMLRLTEALTSVNASFLKHLHWLPTIRITQISCGAQHTLLLTINGDVYGFGDNSQRQLAGNISNNNINHSLDTIISPVRLNKLTKFSSIAAHGHLSTAKAVGQSFLWLWGAICGTSRIKKQVSPFRTNLNRLSDVLAFYQGENSMNTAQRSFRLKPCSRSFGIPSNELKIRIENECLLVRRSVIDGSFLFKRFLQQQAATSNESIHTVVVPFKEVVETLMNDLCSNIADIDFALYVARKLSNPSMSQNFGLIFNRAEQLKMLEVVEEVWRWFDANLAQNIVEDNLNSFIVDFSSINKLWEACFATNLNF